MYMSPELDGEDHAVLHTQAVRQQCNRDHKTMNEMTASHSAFLAGRIV